MCAYEAWIACAELAGAAVSVARSFAILVQRLHNRHAEPIKYVSVARSFAILVQPGTNANSLIRYVFQLLGRLLY